MIKEVENIEMKLKDVPNRSYRDEIDRDIKTLGKRT